MAVSIPFGTEFDMTPIEKRTLYRLLLYFADEDFSNMPKFAKGEWSQANLEAMLDDIERWMPPSADNPEKA